MTNTIANLIASEIKLKEIKDYINNNTESYLNFIKDEIYIKIYNITNNKIIVSDLQEEYIEKGINIDMIGADV